MGSNLAGREERHRNSRGCGMRHRFVLVAPTQRAKMAAPKGTTVPSVDGSVWPQTRHSGTLKKLGTGFGRKSAL